MKYLCSCKARKNYQRLNCYILEIKTSKADFTKLLQQTKLQNSYLLQFRTLLMLGSCKRSWSVNVQANIVTVHFVVICITSTHHIFISTQRKNGRASFTNVSGQRKCCAVAFFAIHCHWALFSQAKHVSNFYRAMLRRAQQGHLSPLEPMEQAPLSHSPPFLFSLLSPPPPIFHPFPRPFVGGLSPKSSLGSGERCN